MVVGQRAPVFTIRTCDGKIFAVPDWLIRQSHCFSIVFPYMKDSGAPLQTTVASYIMNKVFEWCDRHRDDAPNHVHHNIPTWDADFLETNNDIILLIIEAAYRLEIKEMLNIACRAVSHMLGKTVLEVKIMLRVARPEDLMEHRAEEENEAAERMPAIQAA